MFPLFETRGIEEFKGYPIDIIKNGSMTMLPLFLYFYYRTSSAVLHNMRLSQVDGGINF